MPTGSHLTKILLILQQQQKDKAEKNGFKTLDLDSRQA